MGTMWNRLTQAKNVWIAVVLLLVNGFTWFLVANRRITLPEVAPILHPEVAEVRAHWQARDAVGEPFELLITDQMAAETIAWFIEPRPELPFTHPQVRFYRDRVEGGGMIHVMGLQTAVSGTATVRLVDGKPIGDVQKIEVAGATAPDFVLAAVVQAQGVYDQLNLPIEITTLELRDGEVLIEGIYR